MGRAKYHVGNVFQQWLSECVPCHGVYWGAALRSCKMPSVRQLWSIYLKLCIKVAISDYFSPLQSTAAWKLCTLLRSKMIERGSKSTEQRNTIRASHTSFYYLKSDSDQRSVSPLWTFYMFSKLMCKVCSHWWTRGCGVIFADSKYCIHYVVCVAFALCLQVSSKRKYKNSKKYTVKKKNLAVRANIISAGFVIMQRMSILTRWTVLIYHTNLPT